MITIIIIMMMIIIMLTIIIIMITIVIIIIITIIIIIIIIHCVKSVLIGSFSGPYFPAFGLNTERYGISLRIQCKSGKIWTGKTPNTDTFHAVIFFNWQNQLPVLFITVIILKGLKLLRDFDLVWVTGGNISSSIISKIQLIPFAIVVMILNQQPIFFFTVP